MKTFEEYEASEKGFDEFLTPLDQIDWPLYEYILCGFVAPNFDDGKCGQGGEAVYESDAGIMYYETVITVNDKHFYIGKLPDFNNYS